MKRTIIFSILILLTTFFAFAQKEVYLYSEEDIKNLKAQKVQGIGFSTDILQFGLNRHIFTNLHYFHENPFGDSFLFYKSVGLSNNFHRRNYHIYDPENPYNYGTYIEEYFYVLSLQGSVGLRWFFSQKNKSVNNKHIISNSGWYLSLPLNFSIPIAGQLMNSLKAKWLAAHFEFQADVSPGIGYRHAFNRNLFVESDVNISPFTLYVSKYGFNFFTEEIKNMATLNLKIAYTF